MSHPCTVSQFRFSKTVHVCRYYLFIQVISDFDNVSVCIFLQNHEDWKIKFAVTDCLFTVLPGFIIVLSNRYLIFTYLNIHDDVAIVRRLMSCRLALLQWQLLLYVDGWSWSANSSFVMSGNGRRSRQHQQPSRNGLCWKHIVSRDTCSIYSIR